jgi:hypothetical protein
MHFSLDNYANYVYMTSTATKFFEKGGATQGGQVVSLVLGNTSCEMQ